MDGLEIGIVETGLLALGLSLDCFAAAVGRGTRATGRRVRTAVTVALLFGGFHFVMPILGWLIGIAFTRYVAAIDHWIAFFLLAAVGVGMIRAGVLEDRGTPRRPLPVAGLLTLFAVGAATSVDAAAVGLGMGIVYRTILVTAAVIAVVTFVMSLVGLLLGTAAGAVLGRRAEVLGGCLLIGLGAKIVIDHTSG